jgi:hypothetical protein
MPCFFCGKRVSLVRQLTDADFCSDDHRKRYQELTRLALDRLLDAGQRLGTPSVRPEIEPEPLPQWQPEPEAEKPAATWEIRPAIAPQWQPEPAAEKPAYEGAIAKVREPEPEPAPPAIQQPPERRPWWPSSPAPEPAFAMPQVPERELDPPEAVYFARLECEPMPVGAAALVAEGEAFEPSFNAPTTATAPGQCGLRGALFVREAFGRAMSRTMPAALGPGGGNGFHGAAHFASVTPDASDALPIWIHQMAPQPLIASLARPVAMRSSARFATQAVGRLVPRPALPRFRSARRRSAGFPLAELVGYPQPGGAAQAALQPGQIGFMPFHPTAYVAWLACPAPENVPRVSGHLPVAAGAVNAPARPAVAPAAVFQAGISYACQTAVRRRSTVAPAGFADLPSPRLAKGAWQCLEAGVERFAGSTLLPRLAARPAGEVELGGTPPVAAEQPSQAPKARMLAAARRPAPIISFAAISATLPRMADKAPVYGVRVAAQDTLGQPLAARPRSAATLTAAVEAALWPNPEASLPAFLAQRPAASLPAAATPVRLGAPTATSRKAPAPLPGLTAAFTALEPAPPHSAAIVTGRRSLAQSAYASTAASLAAGGVLPEAVPIRAQFRPPDALVEIPAYAGGLRRPLLGSGQPRLGIVPQRPAARAFTPHPALATQFHIETHTPVCSLEFNGRIQAGSHFPAPYPDPRKGSRLSAMASLDFGGWMASLPVLHASETRSLLAPAEPATQLPAPVARPFSHTRILTAPAILAQAEVRLPQVAPKPAALAGTIEPGPLQQIAQPTPSVRPASARAIPAYQIDCRTLFPPAPARISPAFLVPSGTDVPLAPRQAKTRPASAQTSGWALPLPPAVLIEWTARAAAPSVLAAAATIPGKIAGTSIRSTARPSGWLAPPAGTPVVQRESALLGPGALGSGSIERGSYLDGATRAPRAATATGAASPFGAHQALLPPERAIAAREALDSAASATVPPRFLAGPVTRSGAVGLGFRQRRALLPEIRLDATLARIAAARILDECSAEPLADPARSDAARLKTPRTAFVPLAATAPLGKAAGCVRPIGPFNLGTAALTPVAERKAWAVDSRRRDSELVGFEIWAPVEPASAELAARHTLETAAPAAGKGRSRAGAPKPSAASVEAVSTQPLELAGAQPLVFAHPLAPSKAAAERIRPVNYSVPRTLPAWEPYGRESSVVEFSSIQARAIGACWPTRTSFQFATEPERPAKAGRATKADPRIFAEFAVPPAREPESAVNRPALGSAPVTRVAAPRLREDAATAQTTVRLTPLFRPHRHPSRLPVFHTTVEKAHMPSGAFHYVEFEDWDRDDAKTANRATSLPATLVEPWIPEAAFALRARESLDGAALAAVDAGPYPGVAAPAGPRPEQPFAIDFVILASGAELVKMDFEAIAETGAPRWRSALKNASGLFRGVMLILPCLIVLGTLASGCAAKGGSLKETIQNRAAVHMEHDFSTSLDGWYGGPDWAKSWSRDAAGFVRAGQLALYRPSQQLSNYRFEFLGQISGRDIGWVFRAADLQNYYATQLTIVKPGPLPEMALVRYQVIGGKETARVQVPVRVAMQNGRPYRIEEDVAGSGFTTSVDGEVIDSWADDRLRAGAVGFFGEPKDKPNLYWVKVTNNDDFWGKVCGILAPSN